MEDFDRGGVAYCTREQKEWAERLAVVCGRHAKWTFRDEPFLGSIRLREVGGLKIGRFQHNLSELEQSCLSADYGESRYAMFIVQLSGKSDIYQEMGCATLSTGDVGILNGSLPFKSRFEGNTSQLIVYFPEAELRQSCRPSALNKPCRLSSTGGTAVLAQAIVATMSRAPVAFDGEAAALARRTLSTVISHAINRPGDALRENEHPLPDRKIREFIEARIADPALGPAEIARACGMSVRGLHRRFDSTEWSVSGWIKKRRLHRAQQDLLSPAESNSIAQVAFRWGFNDAAHFSRSFREEFGTSPSEFRKKHALIDA